jgi:hypothetical protein
LVVSELLRARDRGVSEREQHRVQGIQQKALMKTLLAFASFLVLFAAAGGTSAALDPTQPSTSRVSVSSSGGEGDYSSFATGISTSGRYVAFSSDATTLVPGDTNEKRDAFVHDRNTGETTRVSVTGSAVARPDGGASGKRTLRTPTPVTGLAVDGSNAAVATACGSTLVPAGPHMYWLYSWNPVRRSVVSMARPRQRRCYDASTGEGIWEAGIGGQRLAWVLFSGGNYQQARLATATSRKPRSTTFLAEGDRNTGSLVGDWVGNIHGDGRLLVFNTWWVCESVIDPSSCPKGIPRGQRIYEEKVWRIVGRRKTLILASRHQAGVLAVAAGRILVRRADGSLQLRSADGRLLHTFPFEPKEVRGAVLDASELVVLDRGSGLTWRVYDPVSGHERRALPAVPHAVPADVERGLLVYTLGRVVHVLRIADGRQKSFVAPVVQPVEAQLEPSGLFYSYRLRNEGRVRFVPFDEIGLSS